MLKKEIKKVVATATVMAVMVAPAVYMGMADGGVFADSDVSGVEGQGAGHWEKVLVSPEEPVYEEHTFVQFYLLNEFKEEYDLTGLTDDQFEDIIEMGVAKEYRYSIISKNIQVGTKPAVYKDVWVTDPVTPEKPDTPVTPEKPDTPVTPEKPDTPVTPAPEDPKVDPGKEDKVDDTIKPSPIVPQKPEDEKIDSTGVATTDNTAIDKKDNTNTTATTNGTVAPQTKTQPKKDVPNTGDASNLALYAMGILGAGAALAGAKAKKNR
ncbi:LPXTG cell wall anchor domain-containing protein [Anaerovoracaceae bacterium SGI.195]